MRQIFVTGATGEIGLVLVEELSKKYLVTALCREKIPSSINNPNIEWVKGDILHLEAFESKLEKKDVIIHLAALTRSTNPKKLYEANVQATKVILEKAKEKKCTKAIVFSSASVTQKWLTPYAKSKKQMEKAIDSIEGMEIVIVRPTIVYGKNSKYIQNAKRMISLPLPFIPLPENGSADMRPVHVRDVAKSILAILEKFPKKKTTFDIAFPEPFTLCQTMQFIAQNKKIRKKCFSPIPSFIILFIQKMADRNFPLPRILISWASAENGYTVDPTPLLKQYSLRFTPPEEGILESL